ELRLHPRLRSLPSRQRPPCLLSIRTTALPTLLRPRHLPSPPLATVHYPQPPLFLPFPLPLLLPSLPPPLTQPPPQPQPTHPNHPPTQLTNHPPKPPTTHPTPTPQNSRKPPFLSEAEEGRFPGVAGCWPKGCAYAQVGRAGAAHLRPDIHRQNHC